MKLENLQENIAQATASANIATLIPTKSDAEIADGIKNEIIERIKPLLKVFDRAKDAGFHVNFQIGIDWTGKNVIQALELLKRF